MFDHLEALIEPNSVACMGYSRLGNSLAKVELRGGDLALLKSGVGEGASDIGAEIERLRWIGDRLNVPSVLAAERKDRLNAVLLSWIGDLAGHEALDQLDTSQVVVDFAQQLRLVHGLDVDGCPFTDVARIELEQVLHKVEQGEVDQDRFFAETKLSPSQALEELSAAVDKVESDCFTHGDYMLPNMVYGDALSIGLVDWGECGVSDAHRDFMSVERTLRRNLSDPPIDLFYEAYGQTDVDRDQIRFFWLLDRLKVRCVTAVTPGFP